MIENGMKAIVLDTLLMGIWYPANKTLLTPPVSAYITKTYSNFAPLSSQLLKIKREEFAAMMQPQAYHDHSLPSEELITTDKSKSTLSLINNVEGKTKFERTCVTCVF